MSHLVAFGRIGVGRDAKKPCSQGAKRRRGGFDLRRRGGMWRGGGFCGAKTCSRERGAAGVFYGPRVVRHWELLKLQARCMEAELPADRPTVEWNETVVRRLLASRSGEYSAGWWTSAVRPDPRWQDYSTRLGIGSFVPPRGTLFIHERCTPSGERRLVVVEGNALVSMMQGVLWVTVVRPAGALWGARVVVGHAIWEPSSSPPEVEVYEGGYGTDARDGAGRIGPASRAGVS